MTVSVHILGVRGSVPVSGASFLRYGGATSCYLVRMGGTSVLLDAGSGLLQLPPEEMEGSALTLLLSHFHLDHLIGLTLCPFLGGSEKQMTVHAARHAELDADTVLRRMCSHPLWPVLPQSMGGKMQFAPVEKSFAIGEIQVETMRGVHPDGVTLFRLTGEGKTLVYITDCTLTPELLPAVRDFAAGADLLLCDGQYSPEEFITRSGYGHSEWTTAARLGLDCGVKQMRIIHHDPSHTDPILDDVRRRVEEINPTCRPGREGEVIVL